MRKKLHGIKNYRSVFGKPKAVQTIQGLQCERAIYISGSKEAHSGCFGFPCLDGRLDVGAAFTGSESKLRRILI